MTTTTRRRFAQVDVFTDTATKGNALAVVLDGEGLSDERMAAFARWATAKTQLDPEAQAERMWKLVSGGIIGTSDEGAVRAAAKGGRSSAHSSGRLRS